MSFLTKLPKYITAALKSIVSTGLIQPDHAIPKSYYSPSPIVLNSASPRMSSSVEIISIDPNLNGLPFTNWIMNNNYGVDFDAKLDNLMKEKHEELLNLMPIPKAPRDVFYKLNRQRWLF